MWTRWLVSLVLLGLLMAGLPGCGDSGDKKSVKDKDKGKDKSSDKDSSKKGKEKDDIKHGRDVGR